MAIFALFSNFRTLAIRIFGAVHFPSTFEQFDPGCCPMCGIAISRFVTRCATCSRSVANTDGSVSAGEKASSENSDSCSRV